MSEPHPARDAARDPTSDSARAPAERDPLRVHALALALGVLRTDLRRVPPPADPRFPYEAVDLAATLHRAYDAARQAEFSAFAAVHLLAGELRTAHGANATQVTRATAALEGLRARELRESAEE